MRKIGLNLHIRQTEVFFFLAYGIFLFFSVMITTQYYKYFSGAIYSGIVLMSMGIAAFGEIYTHRDYTSKQRFAILACVVIYGLISYTYHSLFTSIGIIPLLLFTARDIDFHKIARFSAIMMFGILIFVILSAKLHIIKNLSVVSFNGRHREFLGFRFPLNPATIAFNISALWVYVKKEKLKLTEIIFLLAVDIWIYLKTDSKLAFICTAAVIICGALLKYVGDFVSNRKVLTYFFACSFIVALALSLCFALTYSDKVGWMRSLNRLSEDRLYYANLSLKDYGVTLFGEDIPWVGFGTDASGNVKTNVYANYFYVDNMYIQMMQRYGLILFSIYIILNTAVMHKCRKKKDIYGLMILTLLAYKFIIDNLSFYLYYNTFWFLISYVLLNNKRRITDIPVVRKLLRKLQIAR